jgi:hypothetical protein
LQGSANTTHNNNNKEVRMPRQANGLILLDFNGTFSTIKSMSADDRQEVASCLVRLKQNNYFVAFFSTDDEQTLCHFVATYPEFVNVFDAYKPENYKDGPGKPKFHQIDAYCDQFKAQGIERKNIQILDDDPTALHIIKIRMEKKVQTHQVSDDLLPMLKKVEAEALALTEKVEDAAIVEMNQFLASPFKSAAAATASPASRSSKRVCSPFLEKHSPLSLFFTPQSQVSIYLTPQEYLSERISLSARTASPVVQATTQKEYAFSMALGVVRATAEIYDRDQSVPQYDEGASAIRRVFSGG